MANGYILSFKSTQTSLGGKPDMRIIDYKVCFYLEVIGKNKKSPFSVIQKENNREKRDQQNKAEQ